MTDTKNAEADHLTLFVDAFHQRIIRGFAHETGGIAKPYFQKVPLGIKPYLHFFGHTTSPAFIVLVTGMGR